MAAPAVPVDTRLDRQVVRPLNLGVYLDRSPNDIPDGGLSAAHNCRVRNGAVTNEAMGWVEFPDEANGINLDGRPVLLITRFVASGGGQAQILGNDRDLFRYRDTTKLLEYITPVFTGTDATTDGIGVTVTIVGAGFTATDIRVGDQLFLGSDTENDPAETWFRIVSVDVGGQTVDVDSVPPAHANVAWTSRKVFTAEVAPTDDSAAQIWSDENFPNAQFLPSGQSDMWYATNGNVMVRWNDGMTFSEELSLGFVARSLLRHKNQLVFANVTDTATGDEFPYAIRNSDIGYPEVVDGTGTSTQTAFLVADPLDEILSVRRLGDTIYLYGRSSVTALQFVDIPVVWVARTAVPAIGTISSRSIAEFGDFHEFAADDRAYRFDGVNIQEFGSQVFREILRTLGPGRLHQMIAHVSRDQGEVYWVIPQPTDAEDANGVDAPESAYTEHYLEPVGRNPTPFMPRDLPATAMGTFDQFETLTFDDLPQAFDVTQIRWNDKMLESGFPLTIFGDSLGNVYILNTIGTLPGGSAPDSTFVTPRRPVMDGRDKGLVQRVEPYLEVAPVADFSIEMRGSDAAEGDATPMAAFSFDSGLSGLRYQPIRQIMRYGEIAMGTTGVSAAWAIHGYAVEASRAGYR